MEVTPAARADLGAERAVLGAILVNPELLLEAGATLAPDDFHRAAHRAIFASMLRLETERQPIDLVTVRGDLERHSALEAVGGAAYLAALVDGLPRVTSLAAWAKPLRDAARVRAIVARAARCLRSAEEDATPDELEALLAEPVAEDPGDGVLDRADLARRTFALLDAEVSGAARGISTGFPSLDAKLRFGGWRSGQFVVVGARTSRGKSALMLGMAEAAARTGKRVLWFPLEMPAEDLNVRRLLAEAGVGLRDLSTWDKATRTAALGKLAARGDVLQRSLDFARPGVRTMGRIRAEVRRAARQGLDLVVIDYLGLVRHEGVRRGASLYELTTAVSQDLKALAMEAGVPILTAVQFNRAVGDARPTLGAFRDSGAVEQGCDIALLIHQAGVAESLRDGWVSLILAKQRNGATDEVRLWWNGPMIRFEDRSGAAE